MAQRLSRFVMFVASMAVLLPGVVNAQPMPSQAIRPDPYSTDPKHWHNVQYRVQELAKKLATARCLTPELTKEQGELSETLDAWAKAITIMMKASAPFDSGFSDAYMKASDTMIFEINPAMRRLSSACAKPQQTGHQPSTTAPSANQPLIDQSSIPAGSCEVNGLKMECGAEPPPPLPHQDLFLRLHELEAKVAVTRCRNAELSLELKQAKRAILDIWDDLEGSKAKRPAGSGAYGVYYQLVGLWYAISNQLNALPETCPSPSAKIAEAKSPQDGIGEKPNFDDAPTIVEQPNLSPGGLIRKEAKAQTPRDECQSESSQPCTSEGTEKTKTEQPPQKKVEESSSGAHGGTVGAMPAIDPLIQPVYDMINRDRADVGLGPLERDPALEKGAQQHTYEMKDSDDLHHATREGRGDERENIGKGLPNETPLQVAERWSAEKKKFR
jgi:hypothetical protein